jgi:hypothetical protein
LVEHWAGLKVVVVVVEDMVFEEYEDFGGLRRILRVKEEWDGGR